jgi:hypothetical protein
MAFSSLGHKKHTSVSQTHARGSDDHVDKISIRNPASTDRIAKGNRQNRGTQEGVGRARRVRTAMESTSCS